MSLQAAAARPPVPLSAERERPDRDAILEWLVRSKIRVPEEESPLMAGGYGNLVDRRTGRSPMLYCEITGYAAQFWLRQETGAALSRASAAGDCLLRVQATARDAPVAGAVPYGLTRPDAQVIPAYFSFDAAVCISALIDLALKTGAARFAEGARRAGAFLASMQLDDGSFTAVRTTQSDHPGIPRPEGWFGDGCVLHGKNAIALLKLWRLTGQAHWREAAHRILDWLCGLQMPRGAFPQRSGAPYSMTHTHCYATEGLLYAGLVLSEKRYLTAGIRGAEWLRNVQRPDGALHQDYHVGGAGFPGPAPKGPIHVGPVAQAARIWWVAAQLLRDGPWTEAAARALGFLARVQTPAKDPLAGGAFPQIVRTLGPWKYRNGRFSAWEALFAGEAVRLWSIGGGDSAWSIF